MKHLGCSRVGSHLALLVLCSNLTTVAVGQESPEYPPESASPSERLKFYLERLGNPDYIIPGEPDGRHTWYIAAEAIGVVGSPAIPPLIEILRSSENLFERTQVLYALLLASQAPEIEKRLGPKPYPEGAANFGFPLERKNQKIREAWLSWWNHNEKAIREAAAEAKRKQNW